ncbi:MAG: FkbM family methyltransferase [Bacteroidota bacterium]|nr:FkbM family methyltransferase [Bacteroidota bacterium]
MPVIEYKEENLGNYVVPNDVKNGICVDIGANVGGFLKKNAYKFQKVHFYEPQSHCFEICSALKISNATGFKEAVYKNCNETLSMVAHKNFESGSVALKSDTINEDWDNNTIEEVKTVDLKTVLQRVDGKIDFMKIDCETGEYNFFINQNLRPIKYIAMEPHWQMGKEKYDELFSHIQRTHYLLGDATWHESPSSNKEVLFVNKETVGYLRFIRLRFFVKLIRNPWRRFSRIMSKISAD